MLNYWKNEMGPSQTMNLGNSKYQTGPYVNFRRSLYSIWCEMYKTNIILVWLNEGCKYTSEKW